MATVAKKTTRRKKPNKSTRLKTPQKGPPRSARTEVKYLILMALGVLLALSVYIDGLTGFIGRVLAGIFIGLFGFGAYIMPPALIGVAVYGLFVTSNRGKEIPALLVVQGLCLLWAVIAFMHLLTVPPQEGLSLWAYIQLLYAQGAASNGGLLGGLLGNLLRRFLGLVGAYIVLVIGALAAFVLITGRSFVQALTRVWEAAGDKLQYENYDEEYDDEDNDEYEEYEEKEALSRVLKPLPARPAKKKVKAKGNILDISEAVAQREGKILLFHEEIGRERTFPEKNKVLPFKVPERPEVVELPPELPLEPQMLAEPQAKLPEPEDFDPPFDPPLDDTPLNDQPPDITVKGLISQESVSTPPAAAKPKTQGESAFGVAPKYENYQFPPLDLLAESPVTNPTESRTQILENSRILEETLRSFKVEAKVIEVSVGPTVTRYDMAPGPGVKVATIANLSNDLALSLAAQGIRIEAPIPGKAAVGIEIPNKDPQSVYLRDILDHTAFTKFPSALAFGVGKDIAGSPVVTDVARMPHLLIAGSTGSGKSVCINTLIASILYKAHPDEVKLLMVDPKVVELSVYNGIPHLLIPVVTDPKKASDALQWAVSEMERRYECFASVGARDLKGYNHHVTYESEPEFEIESGLESEEPKPAPETMPQIVIIIDELADLMMTCKGAVEESICRLAQKARAASIHMVLATQRPSVDVITGLIKANVPSRLAFAVSSGTDSRTVLDQIGAEKLLGKGDMLFLPVGQNKPTRLQGGFISDKEVESIVEFLKAQTVTIYPEELVEEVTSFASARADDADLDEFFHEAAEFLIEKGKGSTSMLQRRFRIGYNRASRLMEDLETRGIVGPEDGVKPRKIEISWEEYQAQYGR